MLLELPKLSKQATSFRDRLVQYPFIVSNANVLCHVSDLMDPDENIMTTIFGPERFPHKAFCETDLLNVLRSLGLKSLLSRNATIECCGVIAADATSHPRVAYEKGSLLLEYVDLNSSRLFGARKQRFGDRLLKKLAKVVDDDMSVEEFGTALQTMAWVPIVEVGGIVNPYLPPLTSESTTTTHVGVLRPQQTRSIADCWLCSASMGLVERSLQSRELREVFILHNMFLFF